MSQSATSPLRLIALSLAATMAVLAALLLAGGVFALINPEQHSTDSVEYPNAFHPLRLPRDHAAHPDFRWESWRYFGQLRSRNNQSFAFCFTFIRSLADDRRLSSLLPWRGGKQLVYRSYFTLFVPDQTRPIFLDRVSVGKSSEVAAEKQSFQLRFGDWQVTAQQVGQSLSLKTEKAQLNLTVVPGKPAALYGQSGYYWGGVHGYPSYRLGFTRLDADGELAWNGQTYQVTGLVWADHEFSSYLPPAETIGWDRLYVQLDNNHEFVLCLFRNKDGVRCADCPASLIYPDGNVANLHPEQYTVTSINNWKSPHTDATYPIAWTVTVPQHQAQLTLTSQMPDSELILERGKVRLWSGPGKVKGQWDGVPVKGLAYWESAGYAEPIQRWF